MELTKDLVKETEPKIQIVVMMQVEKMPRQTCLTKMDSKI